MNVQNGFDWLSAYGEAVSNDLIEANLLETLICFIQDFKHDLVLDNLRWLRKIYFFVETHPLPCLRLPDVGRDYGIEPTVDLLVRKAEFFGVSQILAIQHSVNVTLGVLPLLDFL